MKLHLKALVLCLVLPGYQVLFSQTEFFNGVILDDEAYEKTPLMDMPAERGGCAEKPKYSLRAYCPTPGDQKDLPSCTAWALANALTIQKAYRQKITDPAKINAIRHSVSYVYNQVYEKDCFTGANVNRGLELLRDQGNCLAKSFAYIQDGCSPLPQRNHHREAGRFRIAGFEKVFDQGERPENKLDAIMCAIWKRKPVIIVLAIPSKFKEKPPRRGEVWRPAPETHHAMVVVGYDDQLGTFELMNSYGANWNGDGFYKISFKAMGNHARYAYTMELGERFGR